MQHQHVEGNELSSKTANTIFELKMAAGTSVFWKNLIWLNALTTDIQMME